MDVLAACLSLLVVGMGLGLLAGAALPRAMRLWSFLLEPDPPVRSDGAARSFWRQAAAAADAYELVPVRRCQTGLGGQGRASEGLAVARFRRQRIATACRQTDGSWRVET